MGAERLMQCMEVWGGNRAVDNGVVMPGLDAWVYSRPYSDDEAGGDVHYLSTCATGRITRLLVADVAGHGSPVAATADRLRSLMRRYVNYLDQSRFVSRMNEAFTDAEVDGRFATAVVGTFWAPTSTLTISNAGHPRPMYYDSSKDQWRVLRPRDPSAADELRNLPLGVDRPTAYDEMNVRLAPGDLALFYSDSLIEARYPDGHALGEEGLRSALSQVEPEAPAGLIRSLIGVLEARGVEELWRDDVTALLIRRNDLALRTGFKDVMFAGGRMANRAVRSLFGGGPVGWPEVGKRVLGGVVWRPWNGEQESDAAL